MQRAAELEAAGKEIVHMEVGEPDFSTAKPIIDAGKDALDKGLTRYTPAPGISALRDCLVRHYAERYQLEIPRDRILITPGASGGLTLLANMLVTGGEGVLITDPAYPCVRNFIHLMAAEPQLIPVGFEENFQPTIELLDQYCQSNTTGLWLASPSNPTGTILERDRLGDICRWAQAKNLHLLVDEIYHGLHYVDDLPSILQFSNDCFVVNSFSKYFGMTGWRLGWIVVPEAYVDTANILAQNLYISASSIAQNAALAAFQPESLAIFEARRESFKQRRDFLTAALQKLDFVISDRTQGAFYLYADISAHSNDSEEFCKRMLESHGVAITPGTDFGEHRNRQFVRIAFTTEMEKLELGVKRLQAALS